MPASRRWCGCGVPVGAGFVIGTVFEVGGSRRVIKSFDVGDDGVIDIRIGVAYDIDGEVIETRTALGGQ